MFRKKFYLSFMILLALLLAPIPARADGIVIPDPCLDCPPPPCPEFYPCPIPSPIVRLVIRYHRVNVTIENQVAVTHVDQVFYNPNDQAVEGTYIFPLPAGASVTSFTLWVDGRPVEGQILEAEQARQTYHQIVNSLRDPALLEYAGRGAVQAHIFPIPPDGERRIELEYTQVLTAEQGLVNYQYPLSTEKFSAWPLEQVSISVELHDNSPIRAIYSPSHPVSIERLGDNQAKISYEESNVLPATDFSLYYSLGEIEAFHLLSYRDPLDSADPDGFFLALLAPRPEAENKSFPKDLILVLDHSGSMEGDKFSQAQQAVRYILRHLNPEDRFNLVVFSSGVESFGRGMRPAVEADDAVGWIGQYGALGSTDIQRALLEAANLAEMERPTYLIFLTDGLPTEGVVESEQILKDFAAASPEKLRLFSFGVGYDVDTYLLDSLALEHHGLSFYVQPGESLDETLSQFYAKISTPVLTDLSLDFGKLPIYDLFPFPLPDLFRDSQIVLVGRYREGGSSDIKLSGMVSDSPQNFLFSDQTFVQSSNSGDPLGATLPRLWATRKIGYLLNQIRLNGPNPEMIDQVVQLSIRYGIVTPYTSYLVTEELPLGESARERIVEKEVEALAIPAQVFGEAAVQKAADQGAMAGAESPVVNSRETTGKVRFVGTRTFVLKDQTWIDTGFDSETMQTIQLTFLSDDYFSLADSDPNLAAALALGSSVIVIYQGKTYEIIPEGSSVDPVKITPIVTQSSSSETQPGSTETLQPVLATGQAPSDLPAENPSMCLGGFLPLALLVCGLLTLKWMKFSHR